MTNLVATVTSARAHSLDPIEIPGFVTFIEDHDMGDQDPRESTRRTLVLVVENRTTQGAAP